MSEIAQALAKAKERTGQTAAPFLGAGPSAPPFAADRSAASTTALRQARNRQRFWLIVGLVALPLTGFIVWTQLRGLAAPPPASAPHKTNGELAAGSPPPTSPAGSAASLPARAPTPRPELTQAVANLAISAVTPGDPARIVVAGRVIRAGQNVDGGLTFAGIVDGHLHFTDAAGALYTRRY